MSCDICYGDFICPLSAESDDGKSYEPTLGYKSLPGETEPCAASKSGSRPLAMTSPGMLQVTVTSARCNLGLIPRHSNREIRWLFEPPFQDSLPVSLF